MAISHYSMISIVAKLGTFENAGLRRSYQLTRGLLDPVEEDVDSKHQSYPEPKSAIVVG